MATQAFEDIASLLKHDLGDEFHPADHVGRLQRGDEVAINRTKLVAAPDGTLRAQPTAHWHYGIYMGEGKVVDFGSTDNDSDPARIKLREWHQFFSGDDGDEYIRQRTIKVNWPADVGRTLEQSAGEALKCIDSPHHFNCQHLATWCRLGMWIDGHVLSAALSSIPKKDFPTYDKCCRRFWPWGCQAE